MRPWAIAAATLGTAVIITGAFWATWPVPPEVHAPLRVAPERPLREAARREPRAPRRAEARVAAKAPRREPPKPEKDPKLEPDERASARQEFREERLEDINDRLDAFATDAGWSADETDEVRSILIETSDKITNRLAAVDRGELTWDEARRELREYRLDQAEAVRRKVGEDQFQSFVDAMDFSRFLGEQPVRGRLD